jgi:N-acetyl-gamma-glutamyl-phosphate reductase
MVRARVLVDLADDHRWSDGWVYGLTEFAREEVSQAERIANPGCYPTASLLALVPFLRAGVISAPVSIDALSGVSGAGRAAKDNLLYAGLEGSVGAYGTTSHRHIPEIEAALESWGGSETLISFTPHLVPMSRGLLVTARASLTGPLSDDEALQILTDAYADEPFVHVLPDWPQTKAVAASNHAHVHARVDERTGFLIASAAIDNLGKGAAGQALQNANLALGVEESAGIDGAGVWP